MILRASCRPPHHTHFPETLAEVVQIQEGERREIPKSLSLEMISLGNL